MRIAFELFSLYSLLVSKYLHLKDCKCGSKKVPLTKKSAWWIRAPEYHNCFWTYLRHNARPHTLSEVAELMSLSISAITSIEKKAFGKLRGRIEKKAFGKLRGRMKLLSLTEKE